MKRGERERKNDESLSLKSMYFFGGLLCKKIFYFFFIEYIIELLIIFIYIILFDKSKFWVKRILVIDWMSK